MENQINILKKKFEKLSQPVRVLLCFVAIIILGGIIFSFGRNIGEVFYHVFS